jgi:hypothetical protein
VATQPGPEADLIGYAAGIIVEAKKQPFATPASVAAALYKAGVLAPPGAFSPPAAGVSIPDKAVEALHEQVVTQFRRHGQYSLADAREALEAAEPYLTGESRLREALTDLIKDRSNHSSPYPSDYVIEPNELRELLAATSEVKS